MSSTNLHEASQDQDPQHGEEAARKQSRVSATPFSPALAMRSSAKCANTLQTSASRLQTVLTGCWRAATQECYTCQRPGSRQGWNLIQSSVRAKEVCCCGIINRDVKQCWSITGPCPTNGIAIFRSMYALLSLCSIT